MLKLIFQFFVEFWKLKLIEKFYFESKNQNLLLEHFHFLTPPPPPIYPFIFFQSTTDRRLRFQIRVKFSKWRDNWWIMTGVGTMKNTKFWNLNFSQKEKLDVLCFTISRAMFQSRNSNKKLNQNGEESKHLSYQHQLSQIFSRVSSKPRFFI